MTLNNDGPVSSSSHARPSRRRRVLLIGLASLAIVCCLIVAIAASGGDSVHREPSATDTIQGAQPTSGLGTSTPGTASRATASSLAPATSPTLAPEATTLQAITSDEHGVTIGTLADDLLALRGEGSDEPLVVGSDLNGLVVQWFYPDYIYTLRRFELGGITAYRVSEIERRQ